MQHTSHCLAKQGTCGLRTSCISKCRLWAPFSGEESAFEQDPQAWGSGGLVPLLGAGGGGALGMESYDGERSWSVRGEGLGTISTHFRTLVEWSKRSVNK